MKTPQAELGKQSRFIVFILALLFCLVVLMSVILFISHANYPELRSKLDLQSGSFFLGDGTAVLPAAGGSLPVPKGETLYIRCPLPDPSSEQAIVFLDAAGLDAALLVDGRLEFSPSGRFEPGRGFPKEDAPAAGGLAGVWTIRYQAGSELTVAVQFLTVQPSLDALPHVTLSSTSAAGQSEQLSSSAWTALSAGFFLAASCILLFVFLLMLWLNFPDWSILLLAVTAMALCINQLALCSSMVAVDANPNLMLLVKNLTILPLLWLLWGKLGPGLLKKGMFLPVLASTGTMSAALFLQLTSGAQLAGFIGQMRNFWLPLNFFALLLAGIIDAVRRNAWYRALFPLMGCVLAAACVLTFLFYLLSGRRRVPLAPPLTDILSQHTLFPLQARLSVLVIFTCFVLTILRFIRLLLERDRALQTSVLRNRLAAEHADALYRTLMETRAVRHEIRSRTEALRALCEEGDLERIRVYVEQFCEQSQIAPSLYTANTLVNALVAPRFQAAQDAGIQVNAVIQVPESLAIADLDLSTVLSNLLDNAVVAASAVPEDQPRELTFRMELERGRLHIFCRNSYTGEIRMKADHLPASQSGEWHGYGMRLARQAIQKYGGYLDVQYDGRLFTVRAAMLVSSPDSVKAS